MGTCSSGAISQSYASGGTITGLAGSSKVGGLVGNLSANVSDSYSTMIVAASGGNCVGGLVGDAGQLSIQNTYAAGLFLAQLISAD